MLNKSQLPLFLIEVSIAHLTSTNITGMVPWLDPLWALLQEGGGKGAPRRPAAQNLKPRPQLLSPWRHEGHSQGTQRRESPGSDCRGGDLRARPWWSRSVPQGQEELTPITKDFLCAECFIDIVYRTLVTALWEGITMKPIFLTKRLQEMKLSAQGHKAGAWQTQNLNPSLFPMLTLSPIAGSLRERRQKGILGRDCSTSRGLETGQELVC